MAIVPANAAIAIANTLVAASATTAPTMIRAHGALDDRGKSSAPSSKCTPAPISNDLSRVGVPRTSSTSPTSSSSETGLRGVPSTCVARRYQNSDLVALAQTRRLHRTADQRGVAADDHVRHSLVFAALAGSRLQVCEETWVCQRAPHHSRRVHELIGSARDEQPVAVAYGGRLRAEVRPDPTADDGRNAQFGPHLSQLTERAPATACCAHVQHTIVTSRRLGLFESACGQ